MLELGKWVLDAGEQGGRIEEMSVPIARITQVGRSLQDDGSERAGYRNCCWSISPDVEDRVDRAPQGLRPALDGHHVTAAHPLHDPWCCVVSCEYVDVVFVSMPKLAPLLLLVIFLLVLFVLVLNPTSPDIDDLAVAHPSVSGVVARIDCFLELISESLQRCCGLGGHASARLHVQQDVDVVGWSNDAKASVHGVELGHQTPN